MNPRTAPATAEQHASPFEQITALEQEQEARVTAALTRFDEEKREAEKSVATAEKTQETMMQDAADADIRTYEQKEAADVRKKHEQETGDALKALTAHADKKLSSVADSLVQSVLDGSVFTLSA